VEVQQVAGGIIPHPRAGRAPRVLVVEDHRYLGGLLRDVLPQGGFEVSLVTDTNGLEAALDTFEPDVILADFRLRGEDGLDLCRKVRGHAFCADVPVILHTAIDPRNLRLQEALTLPNVTLLLKPADFQTMVALLREQIIDTPGAAEITHVTK
jgi:two-component system OmpR family response regulator/two-component system phosphate regulon response regulator OmpR